MILGKDPLRIFLALLVVALGVTLRILCAERGQNFDVDSYRIVADIMLRGGNVYQETTRYNYGPIWFHALHGIDLLRIPQVAWTHDFRLKVALFLTIIDLCIFSFLLRSYSLKVAALFFLNPISIIITGYHSQFDNFAVLTGLVAIAAYARAATSTQRSIALVILGLSLMTKHVLFAFPLWLAFREKSWTERMRVVSIPYLIFLGGFLFYLPEGAGGIIKNVFLYKSWDNAPFWSLVAPYVVYRFVPKTLIMISALLILGYALRRRAVLETLHLYLVALVVVSSAIANQYLAIPIPSVAALWNWGYAGYTLVGTLFLAVDGDGLQLQFLREVLRWHGAYGYYPVVVSLGIGLFVTLAGPRGFARVAQAARAVHARLVRGI